MKTTHFALVLALGLTACNQTMESGTTPSESKESVTVVPRLTAPAPLTGQRVHMVLTYDGAFVIKDALYQPGMTTSFGEVPLGSIFTITASGYDMIQSDTVKTWYVTVSDKAEGSKTNVQVVTASVITPPVQPNPTRTGNTVILPSGTYYTTDGSDPRIPGNAQPLSVETPITLNKNDTLKAAWSKEDSKSGTTLWSQIKPWAYDPSLTTKDTAHPSWLVGTWWEDDTTTSKTRVVYQITFSADGKYSSDEYDSALNATDRSESGTWTADNSKISYSPSSGSPSTCSLTESNGVHYTHYPTGMHGELKTTRPEASKVVTPPNDYSDSASMAALVGDWWQTGTEAGDTVTIPIVVHFYLKSDSTYTGKGYWTWADSSDPIKSTWSAGKNNLQTNDSAGSHLSTYTLSALKDTLRETLPNSTVQIYTRKRPDTYLANPTVIGTFTSNLDQYVFTSDGKGSYNYYDIYSLSYQKQNFTWSSADNGIFFFINGKYSNFKYFLYFNSNYTRTQ